VTSKRSLFLSAMLVIALAGGTTACGGGSNDKKSADNPPASTSSPGGSGSSGSSGGASGSGGSVDFKVTKDVPSDFPKTDVPMIDGKVLNATKGAFAPSGEQVAGWTVRMKYDKSAKSALADAKSRLTSASFTQQKVRNIASDEQAFKSSSYDVRVRADKTKGGSIVIYTVIPS
jgi:hypothetical protein